MSQATSTSASGSQINLAPPLPLNLSLSNISNHPTPVYGASSTREGGRESTSSHDTTATAHDEDEDEESSEESRRREPDEAPKSAVGKAAMTSALVPGGSGAAAAALIGDNEGRPVREYREKVKDMGIEDKHRFFAPALKGPRRKVYKLVGMVFIGITLWLWICLSFFWGSVYKLTDGLANLNIRFVTFDTDSSALLNAPILQQALYLANLPTTTPHLGWEVRSASDYPNGLDDVRREVLHQESWATVVVNANATSAWREAIRNGDAGYDPSGAIGIYYMGARFYQVQYLYTEALIKEELMNPLSTARGLALQAFNIYAANNAGAIAAAAQSPQTLGVAFGYNFFDLRPIQDWAWAGAAPMEASLIYFVIFAFIIIFVSAQARAKSGLEERLTFRAKVMTRFGWPLLTFFFLSLWQTLVVRAFQIPLDDYLGRAGFVTLWALNYVTIIAAGLALETMLCIVGIPFLPVFLILWIILNITSSFYPLEMLPRFYNFLKWTPFLHNVEGYKIIAYGTNRVSRLGYHFGILFAVIGVELICFPLAMVYERWAADKGSKKKIREEKEQEKKGSEERA